MGILSGEVSPATLRNPDRIFWNFVRMAVFFSLNHGSVTAVLGLAVPLLGNEAGSYSSGTLYIAYALTALLLSAPIMSVLGTRKALIIGAFVYCVYVASFPCALIVNDDNFKLMVAIVGGLIGGFAAGFLWNAQGAYFAKTTKRYALAKGVSQEVATAKFASVFAGLFLTLEVVLKLLASAIKLLNPTDSPANTPGGGGGAGNGTAPNGTAPNGTAPNMSMGFASFAAAGNGTMNGGGNEAASATGNIVVATVYSIIALASSVGLMTIYEMERPKAPKSGSGEGLLEVGTEASDQDLYKQQQEQLEDGNAGDGAAAPQPRSALCAKVLGAMNMWCRHPRILLLNLIQMAFGVSASLLGVYVSGEVVSHSFPTSKVTVVGFMSAMVAAIAALLQVPAGVGAKKFGKPPFMLASLGAFVTLAVLCIACDIDTLGTWPVLVACYLMQGIGRAGYEGTNKAIYADFFPDDSIPAFANIVLANGFMSSLTFFLFGTTYYNGQTKMVDGKVTKIKVHLLSGPEMAEIALVVSLLAVAGYIIAELLQRRIRRNGN